MATTPESFVDALNSAFGKQTTQRAAHAKGVVLLGKFVPSAEAASVSKALHFKHEVPVTVRFSANSGILKIADADPRAAPRGLAIKFRLPDGSDTDLVTHSYDRFPAKNPEEFRQFFLALAGSKPGIPSPTPIEVFQETHPAAKTFLTTSAASSMSGTAKRGPRPAAMLTARAAEYAPSSQRTNGARRAEPAAPAA